MLFDQHHLMIFHLFVHFDYHLESQLLSMMMMMMMMMVVAYSSLLKYHQRMVLLLTRQLGYENHLLINLKQY
jgi:hypothetical protein